MKPPPGRPSETDTAMPDWGEFTPAVPELARPLAPFPVTGDESRRAVRVGFWLSLAAAFGYSFKAILVKLAYPWGVDAVTLLVLRMGLALPFFLWLGWRAPPPEGAEPLRVRDWLSLTVLGVAGYYGAAILDFVGLRFITAGLERLIIFAYPTFTVLIGVCVFGRSWQKREVISLVLSYAGIALAFAHDLQMSKEGGAVILGGVLVLGSTLCYAGYLAGSAGLIGRMGSLRFAGVAMGVSTFATLCHFAVTQPLGKLLQPWPVWLLAFIMALFSTVIPVLALAAAIRRMGSNRAAMVGTVGPVLTIGLGWLLLGEQVSLFQLAGAALVIAGVRVAAQH